MAQQQGQGSFDCRACGEEFNSREQLDEHNRMEHEGSGPGSGSTPTR